MRSCKTLQVFPHAAARREFSLTQEQLKDIPFLRSVPGNYGIVLKCRRPTRMIMVKLAWQRCIEVHGSTEVLEDRTFRARRCPPWPEITWMPFGGLYGAPPKPLSADPIEFPRTWIHYTDPHSGMACAACPALPSPDRLEEGLWCCGCDWLFERYSKLKLSRAWHEEMKIDGVLPVFARQVLRDLSERGRTRADFLEHAAICRGIEGLIEEENS